MFIDDDSHSASGNLSESPMDSEFPASSALVCWRFFGDSAFHKKLSPWQIPASVDLEDSIIGQNPGTEVASRLGWLDLGSGFVFGVIRRLTWN